MGLQGAEQVFRVEQTVTAVQLIQSILTVDGAPLAGGGPPRESRHRGVNKM